MKFALATPAFIAALSTATAALADGPTLQFGLTSPSVSSWSALGTASGNPNEYLYSGNQLGSNWAVSYSMTATDTAAQSLAILGGSISVLNTAAFAQTFSFTVLLPTMTQGNGSMTGGSVSGVLTGNADGGFFDSSGRVPIWTAFMVPAGGGGPITLGELLNGRRTVTTEPNSVANIAGESFGDPIPNQPAPTMGDGLGISFHFTLGAGDKVDFTTALVMQAVPSPGALALLAVSGIFASRRRRH